MDDVDYSLTKRSWGWRRYAVEKERGLVKGTKEKHVSPYIRSIWGLPKMEVEDWQGVNGGQKSFENFWRWFASPEAAWSATMTGKAVGGKCQGDYRRAAEL